MDTRQPAASSGSGLRLTARFVIFTLDAQQYALPLDAVDRVLPMIPWSPLPEAPPIVRGVINLHGTIIPVVDIRRRFGRPHHEYGDRGHLLVAHTRVRRLALPVDEALGVREMDTHEVAPAETVAPHLAYVSGVVAAGGGVLLIHDLNGFLSLDEAQALETSLSGTP